MDSLISKVRCYISFTGTLETIVNAAVRLIVGLLLSGADEVSSTTASSRISLLQTLGSTWYVIISSFVYRFSDIVYFSPPFFILLSFVCCLIEVFCVCVFLFRFCSSYSSSTGHSNIYSSFEASSLLVLLLFWIDMFNGLNG